MRNNHIILARKGDNYRLVKNITSGYWFVQRRRKLFFAIPYWDTVHEWTVDDVYEPVRFSCLSKALDFCNLNIVDK